jgi:hypothetical protein
MANCRHQKNHRKVKTISIIGESQFRSIWLIRKETLRISATRTDFRFVRLSSGADDSRNSFGLVHFAGRSHGCPHLFVVGPVNFLQLHNR